LASGVSTVGGTVVDTVSTAGAAGFPLPNNRRRD